MPTGVLPVQTLRRVMRVGHIKGVSEKYLNPASLDLPLSAEAYRLENIFLPIQQGETVRSKLKTAGGATPHDLKNPLEVGVPYIIRVEGEFALPKNVYGYVNPKSSTGRLNLLARVMADGVRMYEALTGPGWKGEVWVLLRADSFPVLVRPGLAVSQVRLFDGKAFLDETNMRIAAREYGLYFHPNGSPYTEDQFQSQYHADSLHMTIGLPRGSPGWECRGVNKVLDLSKVGHYEPEDFFTAVHTKKGKLHLKKGSFYILTTYEHLVVPPNCAAELRAIDPRYGEFRSHSAGFFDPGWGIGLKGKPRGQPITLEINPHEDMTVEPGQAIARVRFERMKEVPSVLYTSAKSHYTGQLRGAKLSKHFK